jgi:hypothetical protein
VNLKIPIDMVEIVLAELLIQAAVGSDCLPVGHPAVFAVWRPCVTCEAAEIGRSPSKDITDIQFLYNLAW